MKYKINYFFDGNGEVEIEAKDEKEAQEKFYDGEWQGEENEWGENYVAESVEEIK